MWGKSRRKAAEKALLWQQIDERFPPHLFPRIPEGVARHWWALPKGDLPLTLRDGDPENWLRIIRSYPRPPASEAERLAAERRFWASKVSVYLVVNMDGTIGLKPKQAIIEDWWPSAHLVFREFFAATGIHHESLYSHHWVSHVSSSLSLFDLAGRASAQAYLEHFRSREVPAHKERWGEWYFLHIQRAFAAAWEAGRTNDIDTQKAHGDARLANEAEVVDAGRGVVRRSAVHKQKFP